MPIKSRAVAELLFVGVKGSVLGLRKHDGGVAWSTKLRRGQSFVPIVHEGDRIYAASNGEVTCLDAATGAVLWHNELKGYGMGYASLAGAGFPTGAAALEQAARAATAAAC